MKKTTKTAFAALAALISAAAAVPAAADSSTNLPAAVGFRDDGRYLPPVGLRAVALKCVNVPKIHAETSEVPPENVVQMLALEEGAYSHIWASGWRRDMFVEDIAGAATERVIETEHLTDVEETVLMPVRAADGSRRNGIYFLSVGNGDANGSGRRCRVVCVTDLGLSVRETASGLVVWVTSLTKGTPVPNARVEAYSSANILVAEGMTGVDGLCRCRSVERGEPFAVVVSAADGSDRSFIALRSSMRVGEATDLGARDAYLSPEACNAFVWTERGIYRHEEPIFLHATLRNGAGVAPRPFPVEILLKSPAGSVAARKTVFPDALGAIADESLSVASELPSGTWRIVLKTPGEKGVTLGQRKIKVEEFAPPQIRVRVESAPDIDNPRDFAFSVSAEHLFGGPASRLRCEGAIVYQDEPFAPKCWNGWSFGGAGAGLRPNFRRLEPSHLDAHGKCGFHAPLWADAGRPRAAVRATAQGTVFEDGGRPATARATKVLHYYGRYIGATLGGWVKKPDVGRPKVRVAVVAPDGSRSADASRLSARLERIECVYTYRRNNETGWATWDCTRVTKPVADAIAVEVPADGEAVLEIPVSECGDYALTITGGDDDAPFAKEFYFSDWGDDEIRAPLSNPTAVSISADKEFYRPGDVPHLVVKSPFAGTALVSICRDDLVYAEVVALTNATSEIALRPVESAWVPNVDVKISVVQSVAANAKRMAMRAHGELTLPVRRAEDELAVAVKAEAKIGDGSVVDVEVAASGASAAGAVAVVTLVDEGINLLTDEPEPDPTGFFGRPRRGRHPLYDLYHRILPALDEDSLHAGGVKTGGGEGAEMLGRVSPVPTRRFRPLAMWRKAVPLDADGRANVRFELPEFAGEVRVTAVAYNERATGAGAARLKVAPRLVAQPDAPRFVAPGDVFEATLPLHNRSGAAGRTMYIVEPDGDGKKGVSGYLDLAEGESTVVRVALVAPQEPGEMKIRFVARGFDEIHESEILLPVRPAVAWRETAGVRELAPGEEFAEPQTPRFRYTVADGPVAKLKGALEWLADYPHGCLEQTSSRILPLVAAGEVLADYGSVAATNLSAYIAAGVRRVESMIREKGFVMWPDCDYPPWDEEVSLYAAHFLVEAERSGAELTPKAKEKVIQLLKKWAVSPTNSVSAYACHTLALAGNPDRDRMLRLYIERERLDLLSRARLARAFAASGERTISVELLKTADSPASVKEASFALLALLEADPSDARIPALVAYLGSKRGGERFAWGTTGENAHALLALGEYYKVKKPELGTRYVCWRALELPDAASVTNEASGIAVERRYMTAEGLPADLGNLKCGDLLVAEVTIRSESAREYSDLVVEDLFAGAFEPVHSPLDPKLFPWAADCDMDWVMRSDARDDRMLVFSKKFRLEAGGSAKFLYPLRVVSAGEFVLPGVAVDAMYQPSIRARTVPARCRAAW